MAELLTTLKQANRNLHFGKEVVERRAEMAAQCECLAAWIDGRECVCGDITVNVPLSMDSLKRANALVAEIEGCESRLARVEAIKGESAACLVELDAKRFCHQNGMSYYEDDEGRYYDSPKVTLPKSVLIAALNDERIRLMIALHETGIVSVDRDNIRVMPR